MRKNQQKKILELVQTLFEVNDEIKRLFSRKDFVSITQLLADSQAFVLEVGTYIEGIAGEGTQTVTLLEDLHEDLYNASVEISEGAPNNSFIKRLRKQIVDIEASVKTELKPDRIEVVFFPYKASMWDSLESVWLAAKEDPQCDAYVVPIPYYDKAPDGSLAEMHYEGNQFPDYVPIVDWREYSPEEHQPNVVFIHNPYDNGNYVTSVHPSFYSSRLRDLTDLLVYIPYFVVSGDVSEPFCLAAACVYAHKVIVQSEKVRDTYIKYFKAAYGNQFGKPEDKFVAIGSPQFDKVINSKPEDFTLPDEWRKLIEKSDGIKKKTILYNTTVNAILNDNEQYLVKLRSVLEVFRNRDDVVLWWRPHPLSEATYESMRPQLLEEYRSIVADYKSAGFGIYDATGDLHRAIACTDAYYGDGSSLVGLYQITKKPMMIQSTYVIAANGQVILPRALCVNEKGIYFSTYGKDLLFHMDPSNGNLRRLNYHQEDKNTFSPVAFYSAVILGGNIYFSPSYSDRIISINCSNEDIKSYEFEDKPLQNIGPKYHRVHSVDKSLYFVGYVYPNILCYDTCDSRIATYDSWVNNLRIANYGTTGKIYLYDSCVANDLIVAVSYSSPDVVVFNTTSKKSKVYHIDCGLGGFSGICFDGTDFWISPFELNCVLKWSLKSNSFTRIENFPDDFKRDSGGVWGSFCFEDHVYLLTLTSNMILKINKNDGQMSCVKKFDFPTTQQKYTEFAIYNEKVYLAPYSGNEIEVFDLISEQFITLKMDLSLVEPSVFEINFSSFDDNSESPSFVETIMLNIRSFAKALAATANGRKLNLNTSNYGYKINSFVKSLFSEG